jgi:hypothetical protein
VLVLDNIVAPRVREPGVRREILGWEPTIVTLGNFAPGYFVPALAWQRCLPLVLAFLVAGSVTLGGRLAGRFGAGREHRDLCVVTVAVVLERLEPPVAWQLVGNEVDAGVCFRGSVEDGSVIALVLRVGNDRHGSPPVQGCIKGSVQC